MALWSSRSTSSRTSRTKTQTLLSAANAMLKSTIAFLAAHRHRRTAAVPHLTPFPRLYKTRPEVQAALDMRHLSPVIQTQRHLIRYLLHQFLTSRSCTRTRKPGASARPFCRAISKVLNAKTYHRPRAQPSSSLTMRLAPPQPSAAPSRLK